jgi:hypothetical protein
LQFLSDLRRTQAKEIRPGKKASSTSYPVLKAPQQQEQPMDDGWNPNNLPVRTHETNINHLAEICNAEPTHGERLGMHYSMNILSRILCLKSLTLPDSFPHNLMHLLFENI